MMLGQTSLRRLRVALDNAENRFDEAEDTTEAVSALGLGLIDVAKVVVQAWLDGDYE